MKPKSVDKFLKDLPRGVRAVLLFGPDEGQVRERAATLGKTIVADLRDPFNVAEISSSALASDPAKLYDEMAAMSLMGGRRLVRIRDGADGATPAVQNVLENLPPGDTFLIIEAGELQGKSALRKLFEASETAAAALPCYEADARDLAALANDMFREAGVSASRDAVDLFAALVASDRAMARSELDKLILYAGKNGKLDYADVVAALGDSAILDMDAPAWAAGSGNLEELDHSLDRLFGDGLSPVAILRSAQRHFTRLYEVVSSNTPVDSAMKSLKPPVFWKDEKRFRTQATQWRRDKLEDVLARLVAAEADCKKTGLRDTTLCARALMGIAGLGRAGRSA